MYAACISVYKLWQGLNIGRKQLFQSSVFQDERHNRVLIRERGEILLVGAILLCLGLFGLAVNLQFLKQHNTQLLGRVDVEIGCLCHRANLLLNLCQRCTQFGAILCQTRGIDLHTLPLHICKHLNQRLFHLVVEFQHSALLSHRAQLLIELPGDVGILGSILRHLSQRHLVHRGLLCATTN